MIRVRNRTDSSHAQMNLKEIIYRSNKNIFMNIEFHVPHHEVKEWIINYMKEELIHLHKDYKEIGRAEVFFSERMNDLIPEKICEVDLSAFSDSIKIKRIANSFDQAAREVIKELHEKLEQHLKMQNQPPDEITSTIKV